MSYDECIRYSTEVKNWTQTKYKAILILFIFSTVFLYSLVETQVSVVVQSTRIYVETFS